jgi:ferredoxin
MTDLALPSRLPLDGMFIINDTCIDCYLCRDLAPDNFDRDEDADMHYVYKQPETDYELEAVVDALDSCPSASIRYVAVPSEE